MPRGRLIFPMLVELYRLDTAATAADPDSGGVLASGYDETLREPVRLPVTTNKQPTKSARVEMAPITVRAQIEPDQFEKLDLLVTGQNPESMFAITCHFRDLENAGLVDVNGEPMIKPADRLSRILRLNGNLVQAIANPPGLYVVEARSIGFGLSLSASGSYRNLLLVKFESRDQSIRGAG